MPTEKLVTAILMMTILGFFWWRMSDYWPFGKDAKQRRESARARRELKLPCEPGDVFVVPCKDGKLCVAQVLANERRTLLSVACAFFEPRIDAPKEAETASLAPANCFSTLLVTCDLFDHGDWRMVCRRKIDLPKSMYPFEKLLRKGKMGATVTGSGLVDEFLDAYFGLVPWDAFHNPNHLDSYLLDPARKPKNLIYCKRDSTELSG